MKNVVKKLLLLISLCLVLFGVCACGPDTVTSLTLNEDFSGTRSMQMYVSVTDAEEWFETDVDTIDSIVAENCPSELSYWMEGSEEGYTFYFNLDFDSVEDYESKMTALTGTEQTVTIQTPDTVFSAGIYVEESCYSSDLLSWLPGVLVDNGCISADNTGYVLNNSTTSLLYGDTEYTSWYNGKVDIDELDTVSLNGVNILTTVEDDKLSRILIVDIPGYSFDKKGEEIQAYLEERVPAGAEYELTDGDYSNRLFQITIPSCSVSEMESAMKMFCNSENVSLTLTNAATKGNYGVEYILHEDLDLTAYISDDPNRVYSNYSIFNTENEMMATRTCEGETTDLYPYTDYTYPEYSLVSSAYAINYTLDTNVKVVYEPTNAVVTTDIAADDTLTQSVKVVFESIKDSDKQLILDEVTATIPEKMSVCWSEEDDAALVYSVSGSASELNDVWGQMLQNYSLKYNRDSLIIKPFQEYNLKMEIDVKELIGEYVWNFPTEYIINFPGEIEDADFDLIDFESADAKGKTSESTYTVTNATNAIVIKAEGKVLNILGIVIIAGAVLLVVVILIIMISSTVKKNKKKKAENPNAQAQAYAYQPQQPTYDVSQQPINEMVQQASPEGWQQPLQSEIVQEQPTEPVVQENVEVSGTSEVKSPVEDSLTNETTGFESAEMEKQESSQDKRVCPNCGNEVEEDAKFCTKCGAKLN